MANMYGTSGVVFPECGHEHPEWTEYPHTGCPPKSYYMTAYDIAVLHGFSGTETEWLKSLIGLTNYEIYLKFHPNDPMTEEEWEAATDAAKLAAVAAKTAAESARDRAEAAQTAAETALDTAKAQIASKGQETLQSIPDDYETLAAKVEGLHRRVLANGVALSLRRKNYRTTKKWNPNQIGQVPNFNEHNNDSVVYFWVKDDDCDSEGNPIYIQNGPVGMNCRKGFLKVSRYYGGGSYVMQEWTPIDSDYYGQVWVRIYNTGWSIARKQAAWFCAGRSV